MATSPIPPTSSLPQPLSYDQILGQMLSSYSASLGINDLNVGSANTSFFSVVALAVARSSGDIFQILRDYSLDRATGPALQNLAIEFGVPPLGAHVANGFVTVVDLSFQKISTLIYAGQNPPIPGSVTIYASNASAVAAPVYTFTVSPANATTGATYTNNGKTFTVVSTISAGTTLICTGTGAPSSAEVLTLSSGSGDATITFSSFVAANSTAFPPTGSIYIGRGSVNIEGPLPYSSITRVGSYYAFNLSSPTTKFHNIGETIILSQGGVRVVPVNTIVVSPGIGTTPTIQYSVSANGIILDGETTVNNVPITALLPGSVANVPAGAISQFAGNPPGLPNASVINPLAITTGADTETDNQLRVRVKNALASTGLGTVTAIESALQGLQSPTSSNTITSTDVLNSATNTTVYVDNGGIYEATHTGVAIETIVNSALGGEKYFQLVTGGTQTSVTKAILQTVAAEPFDLNGGEVLTVVVGNITYNHAFTASDFANPGSATAYEVAASINGDTTLNYEAVTAGGGNYVVIRPADEVTNVIEVVAPASSLVVNANTILQFPSQVAETLRLYKNGILLTEDGTEASIFTQPQSLWSPTLATGETLSLSVDGTAPITYTLTNAMFAAEGTYTTLSYSNSLQSWADVLNNNITGITATIVGSTIEISSNLGAIDRAKIVVVNTVANPTSLISKGVISITDLTSTGVVSDYILDRNTAQIELAKDLVKGDVLSAGTPITQAHITAGIVSSGSVTLTSDAHVWISIDSSNIIIPNIQSGSTLSVSKVAPNIVRYTTNSVSAFSNVLHGDYVIVWSAEIPATDDLEGRVHAVTGNTLDIEVTVAEYGLVTPVSDASFIQGFVVVRTKNVPQKFTVSAGTSTLQVVAAELQAQTDELTFGVFNNTNITIVDNTLSTEGNITIVTADTSGALLGFVGGVSSQSETALIAFYETTASTSDLPLFFHSTISADSYAEPTYSYLTNFTSTLPLIDGASLPNVEFDPNEMIQFLNPYSAQPVLSGGGSSPLATAATYGILAGSAITNSVGTSIVNGNLGEYPGNTVTGTFTVTGATNLANTAAQTAQADALSAFNTMQTEGLAGTTIPSELGGQTLTPGAYKFASGTAGLSLTSGHSTLTFNGAGTYIIYTASTLLTGASGSTDLPVMVLENGATANDIFWIVGSSATINQSVASAGAIFQGNVIASASITVTQSSTIDGSLIALNAAVTISDTSTINTQASGPPSGTLTLVSGSGDATITFSAFTIPVQPLQYSFTVTSANATAGAVYTTNGLFFTVTNTIVSGTTLTANGAGLIDDEQPTLENVQMSALSGSNVTILPVYPDVRRLRVKDRYFVANPLDFGYNDTVVAIVDNNTLGETYTMPLFRAARVNSTYPSNNYSFNAYDTAAGATASFAANFTAPTDFFANYKVLMQAKYVFSGSNANTSLLYRSALYGRSGEFINVSYAYPTSANQPINSIVTTNNDINIIISLISGTPLTTLISSNTQWNVTVTSNTPVAGVDQVTYTYAANQYVFTITSGNATAGATYTNNSQTFTVTNTVVGGTTLVTTGTGVPLASGTLTKASGTGDSTITFSSYYAAGTAPNLPVGLSAGAYVTILSSTGFPLADTGTFKISTAAGFTPTSTSFSVQVPTGTAVAATGVVTGVPTGMSFYVATPTTASAINTYVNANLSQYVTTTVVNGDGSGIIAASTYEDNNFTHPNYYLKDGINWIFSSDVSSSPQFTLKEPLSYSSAPGYSFFTSGETVLLIPTTMDQVKDFWNVLAVTGFTTEGTIEVSDRGTKLQLATNTLGSVGSIQVIGGSGNQYTVPVLTSGELVGTNYMEVSANSIASQAMTSDQWFRLQAQNYQNKNSGISTNTSVTVLSNTPVGGESTVTLLNQELGQLYFGSPRNGIRVEGDTFRIERQGLLACLSWNGVGTNPDFSSAVDINDIGSWTVNVSSNGVYTSIPTTPPPSPPPSPLATAATYGILAASAITNSVGTSIVNGNLGEYPGNTVTGAFTVSGATNLANTAAQTAQSDALSAFTTMQTEGLAGTTIAASLDGVTLVPGAYQFTGGAATLANSGPATLTFNGAGTYILYTASTLTTGAGGVPTMVLENGATANDIFWIIGSSATINSGSAGTFEGNIVAYSSITDTLGGIVNGSLIALNAAVTLSDTATINAQSAPTPAPGPFGNANFSALAVGDLITITGLTNPGNNGTFIVSGVSPDGLSFSVSNPLAVAETGTIVVAGDFTASTSVSEGDTMILSAPFTPLNQGTYRVIRMNENSVWYENPNVVEEEVTCTANTVSTSYDATTVFDVTTSGGYETLSYTGTGTPPFLGLALPGDVVTFSSGFAEEYVFTVTSANATAGATYTNNGQTFTVVDSIGFATTLYCTGTGSPTASGTLTKTSGTGDATITFSAFAIAPTNQGSFVVVSSGPSQAQVVQLNMPSGATFSSSGPGDYFEIYNGGNANKYAVWYNVSGGSNTAPSVPGFTLIEVTINGSDNSTTVANETNTALSALVDMTHSVSTNVVTVTATVAAQTNSPVDVTMPSAFSFVVTRSGQMPFLTVVNPLAVPQSGISSVTFVVNRPQIQFFPYEATVPGDKLVINGSVLGAGNAGVYQILQVLNPTTVVISGIVSQQYGTNLAANSNSFSVQEGKAYTGYKQVLYVAMDPGSMNYNNIVFNTSAQYEKIDISANIGMTSLSKLNFPTTIVNGTDAYNYDTDLIGVANRTIYGDPRDQITFPGVAAAGVDVFIREPLLKAISIALAIRTNIGVSFPQITSQIQSSVYSLVLSNPLGQSLDLSSIVETVRSIPGVTSVVLTNPAYDINNDEIVLAVGQKAFIPSLVNNINVSLIGS
jgi:hypothetical protein